MLPANQQDKPLIVQILCDSFDKNKSVNYVVRQDKKRRKRIRALMEYSFEVCILFGEVLLSEDKKACALILYPEKKKFTIRTLELDIKLAFISIGIRRIGKVLGREKMIKAYHPVHPFIYLWFIAVAPMEQGKGIGKKLLGEITDKSELLKRSIYLETSVPDNIHFYKNAGFEVYKELELSYNLYMLRKNI